MHLWRITTLSLCAAIGLASGHALASLSDAEPTDTDILWSSSSTSSEWEDLAINELLRITRTEEVEMRVAAVEVLGEMASDRATQALGVVLYENQYTEVRQQAAFTLGQIGTELALENLAVAMEWERDEDVRLAQLLAIAYAIPVETDIIPDEGIEVDLASSELAAR